MTDMRATKRLLFPKRRRTDVLDLTKLTAIMRRVEAAERRRGLTIDQVREKFAAASRAIADDSLSDSSSHLSMGWRDQSGQGGMLPGWPDRSAS